MHTSIPEPLQQFSPTAGRCWDQSRWTWNWWYFTLLAICYIKLLMLKMTICIYTLSQRYLNEVHEQRRLEHPVQPHVTIGQQVGQTSSRAVFHCQGKDPSVQEETQIQIHIFMSHLPQLEMERHIETQTDTLRRSGFFVFPGNVPDGDLVTSTLTLKSIIFSLILIVKKKKTISTVC